jgi:eukaryotic-like serine/threonine-protein kinase
MTSSMSEHPAEPTLADFGYGLLEGELHTQVEDHLCQCEECQAFVTDLPNDRFTQLFRSASTSWAKNSIKQETGYDILGELGRGGMGVVYRARDRKLNRLVALKKIKNGSLANHHEQKRFLQEAEIVAGLVHPGIVQIYEVGESIGDEGLPVPYFAMELVEGESLAQLLERGPLNESMACSLIETLARSIHVAHEHGILHRDLKPANILLSTQTPAQSTLNPKIADFGLAKLLFSKHQGTMSMVGTIMGTPGYMAPEQIRGMANDLLPSTDVYALGAILYECLTGRTPYGKNANWQTFDAVFKHDPIPPRHLVPGLSKEVEAICLKCLKHEPGQRYATAIELAKDLERYRLHQPVRARHATPLERSAKWIRRHPWPAALVGLMTVMIVGGFVGLVVHNLQLQNALTRIESEKARAYANYRLARQTIQQMLARINGMNSTQLEGARQLHSKQLEDALSFHESVLKNVMDEQPEVQFDTAQTLIEVGTLQSLLGRHAQAETSLERSLFLLDNLNGASLEYQGSRMLAWNKLGSVRLSLGKAQQAVESYLHSQEIAQQLTMDYPDSVAYQHDLAWTHHNLGVAYHQLRQQNEARQQFEKAVNLRQSLSTQDVANPDVQAQLSESLVNLALLEHQQGKRIQAQQHLGAAETSLQQLVKFSPDRADLCVSLASLLLNKGNIQGELGLGDYALTSYQTGLRLTEDVLRHESGLADARHVQLLLHGAIANLYDQTGRPKEAIPHWDLLISDSAPHNRPYRFRRLYSLTQASLGISANEEIKALLGLELTPEDLSNLLRTAALLLKNKALSADVVTNTKNQIREICSRLNKQADAELKKSLSTDPLTAEIWNQK